LTELKTQSLKTQAKAKMSKNVLLQWVCSGFLLTIPVKIDAKGSCNGAKAESVATCSINIK
jgi:hypothetical protein